MHKPHAATTFHHQFDSMLLNTSHVQHKNVEYIQAVVTLHYIDTCTKYTHVT